jgi:hypothetical protein
VDAVTLLVGVLIGELLQRKVTSGNKKRKYVFEKKNAEVMKAKHGVIQENET